MQHVFYIDKERCGVSNNIIAFSMVKYPHSKYL